MFRLLRLPSFPLQPWFLLLAPFCVCKDHIPLNMLWPNSQLSYSSLPLTLLETVICSVDSYCVNVTRVIFAR